jgi:uncharacterized protein YfaP (DUF2135 family)
VAPPVKQGQVRIVLTWGETPRDLDSHLDTPSGCHVYYGRKQCNRGQESLDTDVTDSFGPETINIRKLAPGVYKCRAAAATFQTKLAFYFLAAGTRSTRTPQELSSNLKRLSLCTV